VLSLFGIYNEAKLSFAAEGETCKLAEYGYLNRYSGVTFLLLVI
jgi:hypothetical protein